MTSSTTVPQFDSVAATRAALAEAGYLAGDELATAVFLSASLGEPLLLEGDPGVGKTAVALAIAKAWGVELIRLQCHEGMDLHHALYDWNYTRQLLAIRAAESHEAPESLFTREYLEPRPILRAIEHDSPVVLLIDEVDRADDEFEAFLLELLSEFQVTIPELGTIKARHRPFVILTSNRTRELHDALKRRALYHWIDYPALEREIQIVRSHLPGVTESLALRVARASERLRAAELYKPPGVGETVSWARALLALGDEEADLAPTLGVALKVREDIERVRDNRLLEGV
jgi:MoxR-like ATPase